MDRLVALLFGFLLVGVPAPGLADVLPAGSDQNLHGRVMSFDGGYMATVMDETGAVVPVHLHPGTLITPSGLSLAPGMVVSILGYSVSGGGPVGVNEIDTPYTLSNGVASYAGQPWNSYGSDIGLTFFFGNFAWWHSAGFYNGGRTSGVGGLRRGNDFVVPAARGGYYAPGDGMNTGKRERVTVRNGRGPTLPGGRIASSYLGTVYHNRRKTSAFRPEI